MTARRALCALLLCIPMFASADEAPRIAIIIDDIGDRQMEGRAAVTLPGPIACAFLPHTPYAVELAELANSLGKEVLLHLPLESLNGKALGPGAITLETSEDEFRRILEEDLAAIPYVRGVNNHMGSLLTRHPGHMTWLMRGLAEDRLYFIDSYTHPASVAFAMAREQGVPSARRDVFLDNIQDADSIRAEFERLIALAREKGSAIGIGHPYPATMEFLAAVLPRLEDEFGVELVPIEALLDTPRAASQRVEPER